METKSYPPQLTGLAAIKMYFESDGGKRISIEELKALPATDRHELGILACQALGVEMLEPLSTKAPSQEA